MCAFRSRLRLCDADAVRSLARRYRALTLALHSREEPVEKNERENETKKTENTHKEIDNIKRNIEKITDK